MYYVSFIDDFSRKTWISSGRNLKSLTDLKSLRILLRIKQRNKLRCRGQIMEESSAGMNLKNSVRSVV
jgi:hypothetical protein